MLLKKAPKLFQFKQCYDFYFIPCGKREEPPGYLALTVLLNPLQFPETACCSLRDSAKILF